MFAVLVVANRCPVMSVFVRTVFPRPAASYEATEEVGRKQEVAAVHLVVWNDMQVTIIMDDEA